MKAYLKNYRQAPRKVRLVADMVRGKRVRDALSMLSYTSKKAAPQVKKLIESAVANAKHQGISEPGDLYIKEVQVDKGFTFVRYHPGFGGRATPINRESSHVSIVLGESLKRGGNSKSKKGSAAQSAAQ